MPLLNNHAHVETKGTLQIRPGYSPTSVELQTFLDYAHDLLGEDCTIEARDGELVARRFRTHVLGATYREPIGVAS